MHLVLHFNTEEDSVNPAQKQTPAKVYGGYPSLPLSLFYADVKVKPFLATLVAGPRLEVSREFL